MAMLNKNFISANLFASVAVFVLLLSHATLNAEAQVPGPTPPAPPGPTPPGPPGPTPPSPGPSPPSPGQSPGPSPSPKPPGPSCLFTCASQVLTCVLKCMVSNVPCIVACGNTGSKCLTACNGTATEDQISPTFVYTTMLTGRNEATETETSTIEAMAIIISTAGDGETGINGSLHFFQNSFGENPQIKGRISGLSPGIHGLCIYSIPSCDSIGAHFNPLNKDHRASWDENHTTVDLGNIVAGPDGIARVSIVAKTIQLNGVNSALGRTIVVYVGEDDLGRGGNEGSDMTVHPGPAVGCGIIEIKPSI